MTLLPRLRGTTLGDVLVAFLGFALVASALGVAMATGWYPWDPGSYIIAIAVAAAAWPLARWAPRITFLAVALVVAWPFWTFDVPEFRLLPLAIAGYRAASGGVSLAFLLPIGIGSGALGLIAEWTRFALDGSSENLFGYLEYLLDPSRRLLALALLTVAIVVGLAVHRQRRIADELRQRNAQLIALRAAERARVLAQERTAIARDIHDIVAHHVSAMVIRAQAAARVADSDTLQLREAVTAIASDGSEALAAMRQVVRVLRTDERSPSVDEPPFERAVAAMADRVRATGIEVEVSISDVDSLAEFAQAGVLRIVQESLTNAMRHSNARHVLVRLRRERDELTIDVINDGRASSVTVDGTTEHPRETSVPGNGLIGMAERARALGGTFSAGRAPDGGWRVAARVALPEAGRGASA